MTWNQRTNADKQVAKQEERTWPLDKKKSCVNVEHGPIIKLHSGIEYGSLSAFPLVAALWKTRCPSLTSVESVIILIFTQENTTYLGLKKNEHEFLRGNPPSYGTIAQSHILKL